MTKFKHGDKVRVVFNPQVTSEARRRQSPDFCISYYNMHFSRKAGDNIREAIKSKAFEVTEILPNYKLSSWNGAIVETVVLYKLVLLSDEFVWWFVEDYLRPDGSLTKVQLPNDGEEVYEDRYISN